MVDSSPGAAAPILGPPDGLAHAPMANRQDQRGRSKGGERHIRLTHFMTGTPAWQSLKPAERVVYLDVARIYNGKNNGTLARSCRDAGKACNVNKDTAAKAFKVLEERGFLDCTTPGGFSLKTRHAAEWRLTEWACDKTRALPSKRYQHWRPPAVVQPVKSTTRSQTSAPSVRTEGTVTPFRARKVP